MLTEQKVDIVEIYTFSKEKIPVGTAVPILFSESKKPEIGLIFGHVFQNIRNSPKKHILSSVCFPLVFCAREKYICKIRENQSGNFFCESIGIFQYKIWKTEKYILEINSILP